MSFMNKLLSTSTEGEHAALKSEKKRAVDCLAVAEPSATKKQAVEASGSSFDRNSPSGSFSDMYRKFILFGQLITCYVGNQESSSQSAGFQGQSHEPVTRVCFKANGSITLKVEEGSSSSTLQNQTTESSYMSPKLQINQNVRQNNSTDSLDGHINNKLPKVESQNAQTNNASCLLYENINKTLAAIFGNKIEQENDQNAANIDNATVVADAASSSGARPSVIAQNQEKKYDFPANVQCLLSTGMFDGLPVKYVSWDREREMRGIVRDGGYLCGCRLCQFKKVVTAYEFELHAGCKSKHPNNHIYFQNGKSMYWVVTKLQSTPREKLFDVLHDITGSFLNAKKFAEWRESFIFVSALQRRQS